MNARVVIAAAALLVVACCPPCTPSTHPVAHADALAMAEMVPPECRPSPFPRDCNFIRTIDGVHYCCGRDVAQRTAQR
jgi:hypothetical protein